MNKMLDTDRKKEMASEHDFSKGNRGKYAARFPAGTRVVAISPDVAKLFPDSASVNKALRSLAKTGSRASTPRIVKPKKGVRRVKGKRG
jgi:hypothetical protein